MWLTLILAAGCQKSSARLEALSGSKLRWALSSEPKGLDPVLVDTGAELMVLDQCTVRLLRVDLSNQVVPWAAESFEWLEGGRLLRLKLKDSLTWSDGAPIVASDFVAAFERLLSPDLASPFWDSIVDVPGAEEVKRGRKNFGDLKIRALNAHSLELPSSKAYSAKLLMALTQVSLSPYRPGVELGRLSSGLYELVQWTRDQRLILSHRKPVPASAVETIEYLMIRDPSTALRMYESGQLDFLTELPTIELERLKRHPDHVAYDLATTYYVGFGFADTKGALSLELRQALSKVLRQQDIPALLKGDELEAKGWTPENLLPPLARPQKSLSVASPKLAQRNPLILKYTVGDRHRMLMEYVAHRAKTELGLKLILEPSDFKVLMAELRTRAPQLFRMAWSAAYPDPLFFLEIFTSSNPNNFGWYKNPRFDALVAKMQATPFNKRDAQFWKQFREAEHILLVDDPALIPLYHYKGHALLKPKFRAGPFNFQGVPAIAEFGLRP